MIEQKHPSDAMTAVGECQLATFISSMLVFFLSVLLESECSSRYCKEVNNCQAARWSLTSFFTLGKSREHFMIKSYKGITPEIAETAFIEASANIIGDVRIGEH